MIVYEVGVVLMDGAPKWRWANSWGAWLSNSYGYSRYPREMAIGIDGLEYV